MLAEILIAKTKERPQKVLNLLNRRKVEESKMSEAADDDSYMDSFVVIVAMATYAILIPNQAMCQIFIGDCLINFSRQLIKWH
jgi:hypothetical protein